jgi:hypothetical protein
MAPSQVEQMVIEVVSKSPFRFKIKAEHVIQAEEYIEYFEY